MALNARSLFRICGLLLSTAALIWIGARFVRSGAIDLLSRAPAGGVKLAATIAIFACAYALATGLIALLWWRLMAALSTSTPPARPIIATYAVAQYGKYLPGNVAHYALRHAWSRRYGLSHAGLGLATILEAALLLIAALSLTLLADVRRLSGLSLLDPRLAITLLVSMLAGLGLALHLARRRAFVERWHLPALPTWVLLSCLVGYAAFFVACAALLDAIARVLGFAVDSFAMLLAASAASWAAGFIVIGAPGGLGVREAAFVALAGGALGESQALLLIGLFRIVTFLGDTLLFAAGALALRGTAAEDPSQPRSAP